MHLKCWGGSIQYLFEKIRFIQIAYGKFLVCALLELAKTLLLTLKAPALAVKLRRVDRRHPVDVLL